MLKGRKVRSKDLMVFCRQFSTLITAGVTVLAALKILKAQHKGRRFFTALQGVIEGLERGRSLSRCFSDEAKAFPRLFTSMVEAGESGGKLDEVLQRLADFYEKDHDIRERMKTALIYPFLILSVTCTAMVFIIIRVLPAYTDIFTYFGTELPPVTRLLLQLGKAVEGWWYLGLPALALLAVATRKGLQSGVGRAFVDRFCVQAPVYGELYRKVVVARFARILGILLSSGVNLMISLELVESSLGNIFYAAVIRLIRANISRGRGISQTILGNRLFPPMAVEMMGIGEHTGTLDIMLHKIADFTEGEVKYAVDRLSSLIEPVLIFILAIFVGVIALSVFLPMFDMFDLIR